jgi:hypothetical protein
MPDCGVLPASRDEEPLLPRDRYHVQAQDLSPQVEEDCHRRQRGRVDYGWSVELHGGSRQTHTRYYLTNEYTKLTGLFLYSHKSSIPFENLCIWSRARLQEP